AEGDVWRGRLALGSASQKLVGTTLPVGTGFVGDVARRQRTTIVTNAMSDARFQERIDRSSTMVTLGVMATPMVVKGVTVGAIQVMNKVTGLGVFEDGDQELLEGLAASAAVALRNAQLVAAERRAKDLAVLLDVSRAITAAFGRDLEAEEIESGLYLPLRDEEGRLGVVVFESKRPGFVDLLQRELAQILANQTSVAVRNAQLYAQVPLVDALGALAAKRRAWMQLPRRRQQVYVAATLVAVAALTLVKWPLRVSGTNPAFRPAGYAEARTLVPGIIERVLVREGTAVTRGAPLVQLRDVEQRAAREATAAEAAVAERAAAAADTRSAPAEERLQRTRAQGLRREVALLDAPAAATTVRASVSGVVLTARPEERLGARLQGGDLVVTLGRTDTLELEFGVPQREIERLAVGQRVHLRVDALPQQTFEGLVTSL